MNQTDIENIKYIDKIDKNTCLEKLKELLKIYLEEHKKLQKENEKTKEQLKYIKTKEITEIVNIKRSFKEIFEEISKENNLSKDSLIVEFDEIILGGYYFRTNETKMETIQKHIKKRGKLTFEFKIATNKKALEKDPIICRRPLRKEEIERRERVKKIRESDPLYGEYRFDIKPFLPSKNGKCPIDTIRREEGICVEMIWFLSIDKYDDLYYYVEPEFIDLEDESVLSKALKNMLTNEEIKEYYRQKQYQNSKKQIQKRIKENIKQIEIYDKNIKTIEETIKKIETKAAEKEAVLQIIRNDHNEFKNLDLKYRNDKEIALEAITMDGMLLEFVSKALKNDDEIVTKALRSNPLALKFVGSKYKDDKNLVLKLISRCPDIVEFISPKLKENILIAIETVKRNGKLLKYLPKFKNNREVVLEAVKQNGLAILYADNIFFSDKEIMLEVIKQNQSTYLITCLSQNLKDDEEFMKEVCKIHKEYIKYASERLRDKKEFILSICSTYKECIEFASERLKDDFRFELIKAGTEIIIKEIEEDMKNNVNLRNKQKPRMKTILLDRIKIST